MFCLAFLQVAIPQEALAQARSNMLKRLHNPDMEYQMGLMYYKGKGRIDGRNVDMDYEKALQHFLKANAYGSVDSKFAIGLIYLNGSGVQKDLAQSLKWFEDAAQLGNQNAQIQLGLMHQKGEGVEKSKLKALDYFSQAASHGNDLAEYALGTLYLEQDDQSSRTMRVIRAGRNPEAVESEVSVIFIRTRNSDNIIQAEKYLSRSASKGNGDAKYDLATIYYQGDMDVVPKDPTKAAELLKESMVSGNTNAAILFATMLYSGLGVVKDIDRAITILKANSLSGSEDAASILDMLQKNNTKSGVKDEQAQPIVPRDTPQAARP